MTPERLNSKQFDQFRDFIYKKSGIRVEKSKVTMLSNRIRRRVKAGDYEDFDDYYRFLTSPRGSGELSGFLNAITTNETYFFRTQKQFDWLKTDWLTEQIKLHRDGKRDSHLKVLSAACSNGAEPFSIAICLAENQYRLSNWKLEVVGIDISDASLDAARLGSFRSQDIKDVTERQRKRFFQQEDQSESWRIREPLRQLVRFENHNLILPLREQDFDCIFVRNVLIYFDQQSKTMVVQHLIQALKVGGYLVVGPSEGVYGMLGNMKRVTPLVYQKTNKDTTVGQAIEKRDSRT